MSPARRATDHRRRRTDRGFRQWIEFARWVAFILMAVVVTQAYLDAKHSNDTNRSLIRRLDSQQGIQDAQQLVLAKTQAAQGSLISIVHGQQLQLEKQQVLLSEQTHYLCVKLKDGRVVFKNILDSLGKPQAARIAVLACPPPTRKP
jgi:hypothetical protein